MKKVLAICMSLVLVVALPLAASAKSYDIAVTSDNFSLREFWFVDPSTHWIKASTKSFNGSVIYAEASSDIGWIGWCFHLRSNTDIFEMHSYEQVTITMQVDWHDTAVDRLVDGYVSLVSPGAQQYIRVPFKSFTPGSASGNAVLVYEGVIALEDGFTAVAFEPVFYTQSQVPSFAYLTVSNFHVDIEVVDKDAYNTAQIIDQIHTSTDEITGKIDDSTGQIVGELDEIQSEMRGDDWTSPAPGKDDDLNGAMSDYDDAYNAAVGGKSDQEIVDEVSGRVDYDYGALDQQSVSGVTGFLTDLLDSFGADYKSLLMLSLTIGLAVYVIGRRVSSA